jgi:hypothetical protein
MRTAAADAGRDPTALEYTRWGSTVISAGEVETRAREGVTRLVVALGAPDPDGQRAEISAFAEAAGTRTRPLARSDLPRSRWKRSGTQAPPPGPAFALVVAIRLFLRTRQVGGRLQALDVVGVEVMTYRT